MDHAGGDWDVLALGWGPCTPLLFLLHSLFCMGKSIWIEAAGSCKCVFSAAPRQKGTTRHNIGPKDPLLQARLAEGDKETQSRSVQEPGSAHPRAGASAQRKTAGGLLLSCQRAGTACSVPAKSLIALQDAIPSARETEAQPGRVLGRAAVQRSVGTPHLWGCMLSPPPPHHPHQCAILV